MSVLKTCIFALLATLVTSGVFAQLQELNIPFEDIRPILHRPASLLSEGVEAAREAFPDNVTITVNTAKRPLQLELKKTKQLFAADYSHEMIRMGSDGSVTRTQSHALPAADCFYQGKVVGDATSFASIDFCNNSMTGFIKSKSGVFTIEPRKADAIKSIDADTTGFVDPDHSIFSSKVRSIEEATSAPHIIVDSTAEEEILRSNNIVNSCGVVDADSSGAEFLSKEGVKVHTLSLTGTHDHDHDHGNDESVLNQGGDLSVSPAKEKEKRYVELLVFNDHARYKALGESTSMMTLQLINDISSYYRGGDFKDYDVEVVLKGQVTFTDGDPYSLPLKKDGSVKTMGNDGLLNVFNWYRSTYSNQLPAHDLGMLLSAQNFEDNIRGLATVGSVCMHPSLTGSINQVTFRSRVMNAVTAAHELGHNLGSPHDAGAGYIMQPYVGVDTKFSAQSKSYIESYLRYRTCLNNNPFQGVKEREGSVESQGAYSANIPIVGNPYTKSITEEHFSLFGLSSDMSVLAACGITAGAAILICGIAFYLVSKRSRNGEQGKPVSTSGSTTPPGSRPSGLTIVDCARAGVVSEPVQTSAILTYPSTGAQASRHLDSPAISFVDVESPKLAPSHRSRLCKSVYTYDVSTQIPRLPLPPKSQSSGQGQGQGQGQTSATAVTSAIEEQMDPPCSPLVLPSPVTKHIPTLRSGEIVNISNISNISHAEE